MNALTSSILRSLFVEHHNKNWVFSPASYLEAMRNLALCLKGQNLAELVSVAPDIEKPQSLGLDTYNYLLYSAEYQNVLNKAVVETLESCETHLQSFDGSEVVDMVNNLVAKKTHGKISHLLTPDDITEFTKFIILNCVYFKKDWSNIFYKRWYKEPFLGAGGVSNIEFLSHRVYNGGERYYEDASVDIVELSYKNSNVACYLIVPKTSLFELFNELEGTIAKIALVKAELDLDVTVPSFKTEGTFELKQSTQSAGVKNIWRWSKDWTLVNWTQLKDQAALKVELIRQKTYLSFDENGTEVTATTAILLGVTGCCGSLLPQAPLPIKYIRADKPFMYVLANKQDPSTPLFVGIINNIL